MTRLLCRLYCPPGSLVLCGFSGNDTLEVGAEVRPNYTRDEDSGTEQRGRGERGVHLICCADVAVEFVESAESVESRPQHRNANSLLPRGVPDRTGAYHLHILFHTWQPGQQSIHRRICDLPSAVCIGGGAPPTNGEAVCTHTCPCRSLSPNTPPSRRLAVR